MTAFYTSVERFAEDMAEAHDEYAEALKAANDAYLSKMESMMQRARGLDVQKVLGIVQGTQVRINAARSIS